MATKPSEDESFDVEATLNDLDNKLARLRVMYEQYFLGIEKRAPSTLLKQIVRIFHILETATIKNTAHKFRLRSLIQKFQAYRAYWNRTSREIENGTYRRHVQKVRNREQRRAVAEQAGDLSDLGDLDFESGPVGTEPAERTFEEIVSPYRAATPAPSKAAAELGSLADDFLKQLTGKSTPAPVEAHQNEIRGMAADSVQKRSDALQKLRDRLTRPSGPPSSNNSQAVPERAAPPSGPTAPVPRQVVAAPPAATPAPAPARVAPPSRLGPHGRPSVLSRPSAATSSRPSTAPTPAAAAPAADPGLRRSLDSAGLSEQRLRNLYDSLVDAKKRCNEPVNNLSYDGLVRSIAKQAPAVQQKNGGGAVDFQVVIKKGKAYLKPLSSKDDDD